MSALTKQLESARDNKLRGLQWGFRRLIRLAEQAEAEHAAGNIPEATVLMNQALDLEWDLLGDCEILGPVAEAWGIDVSGGMGP